MKGKIASKNVWVTIMSSADVRPGEINSGFQYGQEIAIAREKGGALYAMSNKLPPTGQPATFGKLAGGGIIVDPLSLSQFNLKAGGKPVGTWCPSPVGKIIGLLVKPTKLYTYPVRETANKIQCLMNVNLKAQFESNYWRGVLDAQGKVDGGYY